MRSILSLLIMLFIFTGCDSTYDNSPQETKPEFNINLAPAFAPGATVLVPVNSQLILHASATLDPSTVNENTIYIQNTFGERQDAYISLLGQDIIVKPKVYLTAFMDFEIVITTALVNSAGTHLAQTIVIPFSSDSPDGDTLPPVLVDHLAKDKGTIEPQTILYYQFSEPISPLNISDSIVSIVNSIGSHTIQGRAQVSGTLLIFTPNEPFISNGDTYTITLDLNQTISDLAGNILSQSSQIDSLSISSALPTTQKSLHQNYYNSNSQVHCIESGPSSSSNSNLLYVGGTNGLEIIEFNLLTHSFTKRAQIDPNIVGAVYSIEINTASKRLYLGSSKGFSIYDIGETSNPIHLSTYQTTSPVYGAQILGDHAYLAASLQGVVDLNISNETVPSHIFTSSENGATAFDITIHSNNIIVADYDQELTTYDIDGISGQSWGQTNKGHVRTLLKHPSSSFPDTFLIASGIAGFKAFTLEVDANTYYNNYTPAPSYVSKVVANTNSSIYFNVANIGIAELSSTDYSHQGYLVPQPFIDTITFTQVNDSSFSNIHLILVDNTGRIYSMVL